MNLNHVISTFQNRFRHIPGLAQLIELILKGSYIQFNGLIFHQIQGMPMGTNMAVNIAQLYLYLTLDLSTTIGHAEGTHRLHHYSRFIDDTFAIWNGSIEELHTFVDELNQLLPGIKFTYVINPDQIDFLDLTVFKTKIDNDKSQLSVKIHQKIHNKYLYLPSASNHTMSLKRGFIKGELIRAIRSCTFFKDFAIFRNHFRLRLQRRGYNNNWLDSIFSSVQFSNRNIFLSSPQPSPSNSIYFIINANERQHRIHLGQILREFLPLLPPSEPFPQPLLSLRSSTPLRSFLYRSFNQSNVQYQFDFMANLIFN